MKRKNLRKKLSLNKHTVATLSSHHLRQLYGGDGYSLVSCPGHCLDPGTGDETGNTITVGCPGITYLWSGCMECKNTRP